MQNYQVFRFDELDSTNNYVKQHIKEQPIICIADTQRAGRGRNDKVWQSPAGKNIYCTMGIPWDATKTLAGFSLIVALAVLKTLEAFNLNDLSIKWPNDVFWQGKKIAGILIEVMTNTKPWNLVIGIGININATSEDIKLERAWTSVAMILGVQIDREPVLQELIKTVDSYIKQYKNSGLSSFMDEWQQYDFLYAKKINIKHNNQIYTGTCKGINNEGALLLQLYNYEIMPIISGEVHLETL